MITSKLTSRSQTTIPRAVRRALGVGAGDDIAYVIDEGQVVLTRATPSRARSALPFEDPFEAFEEWHSAEDIEAFRDL